MPSARGTLILPLIASACLGAVHACQAPLAGGAQLQSVVFHVDRSLSCFAGADSWCAAGAVGGGNLARTQQRYSEPLLALVGAAPQRDSAGNSSRCGSAGGEDGDDHPGVPAQHHKHLSPIEWEDIVGFVLVAAASLLTASSGLGGGALLVPIYMLVFGFRAARAVALSNATIVGGCLANLAFNVARVHPLRPERPLIDWDLILVMEPSTILGALVGGYLNVLLPGWLATLALASLLGLTGSKLLTRARNLHREERQLHANLRADLSASSLGLGRSEPGSGALESPLLGPTEDGGEAGGPPPDDGVAAPADGAPPRRKRSASPPRTPSVSLDAPLASAHSWLEGGLGHGCAAPAAGEAPPERAGSRAPHSVRAVPAGYRPHVDPVAFAILLLLLAGVVASDIFKHSFACPSLPYWAAATAMAPITLLVLLGARRRLVAKTVRRKAAGRLAEGDIRWDGRTTLLYPALCTFAGVAAGMFGVGGGIVKGPLMLELGVLPEVAAATSATMIFFTASAAATVFLSFGQLPLDYGAVAFSIGLATTASGQGLMLCLAGRRRTGSVVVASMATVMLVSSVVLGGEGGLLSYHAARAGELWRFGHLCGGA